MKKELAERSAVLTVCAIGRNEARNLPRLIESLRALSAIGRVETIYVDSASSDRSIEEAMAGFDYVVRLKDSPDLNASAARYIGTKLARTDWILYLDGDMTLRSEFIPTLQTLVTSGDSACGVVGRCVHAYPDGSMRTMTIHGNRDGKPCKGFGGAVILPRNKVLSAGNWNPGLYAYEEIELYGRLRGANCKVIYHDVRFADHHTNRISKIRMLLGSMLPVRSVLGKKYYGAGQAIAASLVGSTLRLLIGVKPGPFIFSAGLIVAAAFIAAQLPLPGLLLLSATLIAAVRMGGWYGPIVYATWLPQALLGLFRYRSNAAPQIEFEWQRSASRSSSRAD